MSKSIANNRYNIVIKVIGTVAVFESIPVYTAESFDSTSYDMTPQSPVSPSITLAENYCRYIVILLVAKVFILLRLRFYSLEISCSTSINSMY